jgi:IS30 family transposase
MNYTHLTQNERYQIYILSRAGHKQNEIAQLLNRHPSTIRRELARNRGLRGYRPRQAQHLSEVRSGNNRNSPRIASDVWDVAQVELLLQHGPEQIAARLPVSHEALYQRIYADKSECGDLWRNLRCQKKWFRLFEQLSPIYKWNPGGLDTVQSCTVRRTSPESNAHS